MSLEQALLDCTEAIKRLTVVMSTVNEDAAPAKPSKAKAAKEQAIEVVAKAASDSKQVLVNEGDAPGTRYFWIEAHNTVYKQAPGDADCTLPGAVIVSGTEYLQRKEELAKKFPTATTAPTATAPQVVASATAPATFEAVVNKMRALHAAKQNAGVKKVLEKYGVSGVPALNGKATNDELIAAIDEVMASA